MELACLQEQLELLKQEKEQWKFRALKAENLISCLERIEVLRKNALETYQFSLDENGEVVI